MKEKVLLWGYSSHSAAHGLPGQPLKGGWPQGAGGRVQPAVDVDDCWGLLVEGVEYFMIVILDKINFKPKNLKGNFNPSFRIFQRIFSFLWRKQNALEIQFYLLGVNFGC